MSNYTLFHVARYTGLGTSSGPSVKTGSRGRIFAQDSTCAPSANWLSGFWFGHSGVAYHEGWITAHLLLDSSPSYHGDDWVVSSDSFGLYRSNGISRVDSGGGSSSLSSLAINKLGNNEYSDFMVADVILFNTKLSSLQIATIENYLFEIYGIPLPGPMPIMKGDFDARSAAHETALTYSDMKAICENKGQRLCLSREICDMSKRQVISPELTSTFSGDNWIAVGDKQDEWLTLHRAGGRYCKTHTEVGGSTPDWSNTNYNVFLRLVKCCFSPPGKRYHYQYTTLSVIIISIHS